MPALPEKNAPSAYRTKVSNQAVGKRIRKMRHERGLTLTNVKDHTGIPVSALSKLETGKQSMSYVRLLQIAELFEVELSQLFEPPESAAPSRILGRRSIHKLGEGGGVEDGRISDVYLATDLLQKEMTPILCTTRAKVLEEFGNWSHHAGEEFVFVLEGQLSFHSEMYAPVTLNAGESIYFDAEIGHAYLTGDTEHCQFLSVCHSSKNTNS